MGAFDKQEGGSHYNVRAIQPVQYSLANGLPFCEGNVVKYVTRWRDKGGVQDLKKAIHFLEMLIEYEETKKSGSSRLTFPSSGTLDCTFSQEEWLVK